MGDFPSAVNHPQESHVQDPHYPVPRLLRSGGIKLSRRIRFNIKPSIQTRTKSSIKRSIKPSIKPSIKRSIKRSRREDNIKHSRIKHSIKPSRREDISFAMSLHQVEAHSPRRALRRLSGAGEEKRGDERYYQSIKRLLVGPVKSKPVLVINELKFDVSDSELQATKASVPEATISGRRRVVCGYFDGSLRYRLRICKFRDANGRNAVAESDWVVQPTEWPQYVFITVNDKAADIRRKTHYGQDQPLELTPLLVAGKNRVQISITSDMPEDGAYFMAVELVETLSHGHIMKMVREHGLIAAESTKHVIQNRLRPKDVAAGGDSDDDDIAIVDSSLSIDLADPFAARMFTIPARGASCTHLECFDLETWLNTRTGKPIRYHGPNCLCDSCESERKLGPEPSLTDKWACPLCGKDARPYSLRIDGFLIEVAATLTAAGKADAKKIAVTADGVWEAKEEAPVARGTESPDSGDERPQKRAKSHHSKSGRPVPEVIELD
ncbi:hypothetical protein ACRALDRAFT_1069211 [Sodiomyces alcalophilus JCM 7366]|uniref:uncharacterized protein n=1 Tax=Sodiomyces alcalophilus JCM 7366 TaxID=591952 RepID=UPI0039B54A8F